MDTPRICLSSITGEARRKLLQGLLEQVCPETPDALPANGSSMHNPFPCDHRVYARRRNKPVSHRQAGEKTKKE